MDVSYPGIHINVEFSVLKEYLAHLDAGINAACETYKEKELREYEGSEYFEYQHVYAIAEDEMPRIIRLPLVVSIAGVFESSITQLLKWLQEKEKKELSLKDINARSKIQQYNKYLKYILGFEYQFSTEQAQSIEVISRVRNCVAHCNSNVDIMNEHDRTKLLEVIEKEYGLSVDGGGLDVNQEFLLRWLGVIEEIVKSFMLYIEQRYGWV